MRIPFHLCTLLLLGSSAWAHDDEANRYYLHMGLGGVFSEEVDVHGLDANFDPGFMASLAVGRHFPFSDRFGIDIELEGYYQYFKLDDLREVPSSVDDDSRALAFLVNGLLEWHFTPQFSVYGGGGVGWANKIEYASLDSGNLSQDPEDGVAFQGRFGLGYNLGGSYDFRFGYRYFMTEPVDIIDAGVSEELSIAQHGVEFGFRWGL